MDVSGLRQLLVLAALGGALAGCGGGGGENKPPTGGPNPAPVELLKVQTATAKAAPTVPAAARGLVTEVLTSQGAGTLGGVVKSPEDARVSSDMTMALSSSGDIVLASVDLAANGTLEMDARTTSVALVRIAIGSATSSARALDAAIANAAPFQALVSATQSALDRGVPPSADAQVARQVVETMNTISASLQQGASPRMRALALPTPRIEQLPFMLIDGDAGYGEVEYGGTNSTALHWSFSIAGDEFVVGPGGPTTMTASGTGAPHVLRLSQKWETRALNFQEVMRTIALAAMGVWSSDSEMTECTMKVSESLLDSDKLVMAMNQTSSEAFKQYLRDLRKNFNPAATASLVAKCLSAASAEDIAKRITASITFLKYIEIVEASVKVASAARTTVQLIHYWSFNVEYGVCEDAAFRINSCATRFAIEPHLYLMPGASTQPEYLAYAAGAQRTGRAAGMKYSSLTASTLEVDLTTGRLTGLLPGTATVNALEPVSEVASDIPVTVVMPKMDPEAPTVALNSVVVLSLKHPDSALPLVTEGAPVVWSVSDETVLELTTGGHGGAILRPLAEGEVTVTAHLVTAGKSVSTTVRVRNEFYLLQMTPYQCVQTHVDPWRIGDVSSSICNQVMNMRYNDAYRIAIRPGDGDFSSARLETNFNGAYCRSGASGSPVVFGQTQFAVSFRTWDPWNSSAFQNVQFAFKRATPTATSGTFEVPLLYGAYYDDTVPPFERHYGTYNGKISGQWTMTPIPAFPKCIRDPIVFSDGSQDILNGCHGVAAERCDFRYIDQPARPGDWAPPSP